MTRSAACRARGCGTGASAARCSTSPPTVTCCSRSSADADVLARELRARHHRAPRHRLRDAAGAQPGPRVLLDHRVRPRHPARRPSRVRRARRRPHRHAVGAARLAGRHDRAHDRRRAEPARARRARRLLGRHRPARAAVPVLHVAQPRGRVPRDRRDQRRAARARGHRSRAVGRDVAAPGRARRDVGWVAARRAPGSAGLRHLDLRLAHDTRPLRVRRRPVGVPVGAEPGVRARRVGGRRAPHHRRHARAARRPDAHLARTRRRSSSCTTTTRCSPTRSGSSPPTIGCGSARRSASRMQPIRPPEEALADPALLEDGCVAVVDDPELGPINQVGITYRLSAAPTTRARPRATGRRAHRRGPRRGRRRGAPAPCGTGAPTGPLARRAARRHPGARPRPGGRRTVRHAAPGRPRRRRHQDQRAARQLLALHPHRDGLQPREAQPRGQPQGSARDGGAAPSWSPVPTSCSTTCATTRRRVSASTTSHCKRDQPVVDLLPHPRVRARAPRAPARQRPDRRRARGRRCGRTAGCGAGGRPMWSLTSLGDLGNGFLSAIGMLQALYHRDRTGEGQFVDTSILNACLLNSSYAWLTADGHAGGTPAPRRAAARHHRALPPVRDRGGLALPRRAHRPALGAPRARRSGATTSVGDERVRERRRSRRPHDAELLVDARRHVRDAHRGRVVRARSTPPACRARSPRHVRARRVRRSRADRARVGHAATSRASWGDSTRRGCCSDFSDTPGRIAGPPLVVGDLVRRDPPRSRLRRRRHRRADRRRRGARRAASVILEAARVRAARPRPSSGAARRARRRRGGW